MMTNYLLFMSVKSILCIFYFCLVFLNKHFQTVYEFVFGVPAQAFDLAWLQRRSTVTIAR